MRLTGRAYLNFLQEQLPELLEDVPLDRRQGMWYQHDVAPAHFTHIVRDWLDESFPNRWIGRGGAVNWPARSLDLNPLDFFLWGHVKTHVYGRNRPQDLEDLCARIHQAVDFVTEEMLHRTLNNLIVRARKCIEVGGGHFEQLLWMIRAVDTIYAEFFLFICESNLTMFFFVHLQRFLYICMYVNLLTVMK